MLNNINNKLSIIIKFLIIIELLIIVLQMIFIAILIGAIPC